MDRSDLAAATLVALRPIVAADLAAISNFLFTVSITEPLTDLARLREVHAATGLWLQNSGAAAIVAVADDRLVGTCQFYPAGACIHGLELGYIIHDPADRGQGFASGALRLFGELLLSTKPDVHRLQLMIEVWNGASCKVAQACGYAREGVLRSSGYSSAEDPEDCFIYSLTRKDWRASRRGPP